MMTATVSWMRRAASLYGSLATQAAKRAEIRESAMEDNSSAMPSWALEKPLGVLVKIKCSPGRSSATT